MREINQAAGGQTHWSASSREALPERLRSCGRQVRDEQVRAPEHTDPVVQPDRAATDDALVGAMLAGVSSDLPSG